MTAVIRPPVDLTFGSHAELTEFVDAAALIDAMEAAWASLTKIDTKPPDYFMLPNVRRSVHWRGKRMVYRSPLRWVAAVG